MVTLADRGSYIIVSAVRNEEAYIESTLKSVIIQSVKPMEWIIVNDGSRDKTESIIRKYTTQFKWIKYINRTDRGFAQVGQGVIEAFNDGYRAINEQGWRYIVKMDCDLSIDKDFFEELINEFESTNTLGIAGGTSYLLEKSTLEEEKMAKFHPCAACRMYRRECFNDIGGLKETLGWDTIDLLRAQMRGWRTGRFDYLKITHYRRMASRKGLWEGKLRTGKNFYITGYHPLFLIARSIYRLKEKPYFIESAGVILGYLRSFFRQEALAVTKEEKEFLQKQQLKRLLGFNLNE